ncbi:predicted protein [Sclerotinia sclerotiorum 1980 UF-70]|uniref:Uncharacterized protein n=1 Tax=Sclerotinia sclerotiorum (strain ATCC 18683 / 1980 / Ss-1) TaxID=665079 RepID=A7EP92_SCLS1|nr:predicted protein [Sclerotinia sclerotiorum 1980 UF-70]EDO04658.1 predicted protein [Sclerotinia sclerotiorum 1980 UF-70]
MKRDANNRHFEKRNLLESKRKLWVPNMIDTSEYAEEREVDGGEGGNVGDMVDEDTRSGADKGNDGRRH